MKKNVLLTFIAFLGLAVGFVYFYFTSFQSPTGLVPLNEVTEVGNDTYLLRVDKGDAHPVTHASTYAEGQTAFGVLQDYATQEDINLVAEHYDFGVFVKAIDGLEGNEERAWIYFVNGESGSIAADQYLLQSGDVVEWRYVEPN